jgi:hypothetical protein
VEKMMEKIGALMATALVLTVAVPAVGADSYEGARDE